MFKPLGMFSWSHLVYTLCSFLYVFLMILFTRKKDKKIVFNIIRIMGIAFILLEVFKILFEHFYLKISIEGLIPLYYCSMYLYIVILLWIKNDKVKQLGLNLLMYYGLFPGMFFTLMPFTAVNYHGIISFPFIHSFIYHGNLIYVSLIIMIKGLGEINKKATIISSMVFLGFGLFVFIINLIFKKNFMYISDPGDNYLLEYIVKLVTIYGYPFFMIIIHAIPTTFITYEIYKIASKRIKSETLS